MIILACVIVLWLGFLSVRVMELSVKNKDLINIVKALSISEYERSRDKGKTKPNKPRANRPTPAIGKTAPRQR